MPEEDLQVNLMDDLEKLEAGGEWEGRVQYSDPLLVPTPVLLAQREVPTRYPQATINQLHRATEETLVYRQHSELSCQLPGAPKSTFLMVFSPDGSRVASTHGDHNIYVSEVKTGQCISTLEGHPRTPWCVAFHPASNDIIASGCLGGVVRVWDLKGGSEVWTSERKINIASLAFHPTDQVLVIATFNEIYFWDWFMSQPFAKICTPDEKEKVRYVKFDPLGHKLITGIAYTLHDRPSQGSCRLGGSSSGSFLSRSELVEREQQLSQSYNQLSNQYINLVSRFEALTSRAFSNVFRAANRIDRGTNPIEPPPPATTGLQALLNEARHFAQQVTEERRGTTQSQDSPAAESSRSQSTWTSADSQGGRDSQSSSDMNLRLEEDYGLNAVRTLRQIISDDSASSSSLDSSSSATSGASGVSERNTRLSLLWTSRLHRPWQDSDSAGEASSVYSLGDSGMVGGQGDHRARMGGEEGTTGTRRNDGSGAERRNYRGTDDRASDDDDASSNMSPSLRSTGSQSERAGTLWGYFSGDGPVIPAGRSRTTRESRSESVLGDSPSNETDDVVIDSTGVRAEETQDSSGQDSAGNSEIHSSGLDISNVSTLRDSQLREIDPRRTVSPRESHSNQRDIPPVPPMPWMSHTPPTMPNDPNEDLAIPGPSGLSRIAQSSLAAPSRYPTSYILDSQFGVQLLSRHIENMQRICIAHLEITRHRHEVIRLQQIHSMLRDIQHQIQSLRMSVDQIVDDLGEPPAEMNNSTSHRGRGSGEEDSQEPSPNLEPGVSPPSLPLIRHWSRTCPRSVARVPRGPFGTRMQARHSHRSWMMSSSVFPRVPRRSSIRTRLRLPGPCEHLQGTNGTSRAAAGGRISPTRGLVEPGTPTSFPGGGAVVGPLPTPPPDQGHSEEQPRDIVRIVSGNQYGTQTRMMRYSMERFQERLRERREELEQEDRLWGGFLSASSPSSSTSSSATSSVSLDREEDPPSPPERYRRAGPPTTSLASRIASMMARHSSDMSSNSLSTERYRRAGPPTTSLASRIASMMAQHSSGMSSNSLSTGPQENSTGRSRSEASIYMRPRPSLRSILRPSGRPYDRPHGRLSVRWADLDSNRLSGRGSERLLGRNSDRPRGRNSGRNSDRLSSRPYDRSSDSSNPWCGTSLLRRLTLPGPPPTAPPTLPELDDTEPYSNDSNNNSSQCHRARQRLRQTTMHWLRVLMAERNQGNAGDTACFPMDALRICRREGFPRMRRDQHRQILQRMADCLNSLINQEQEHQHQNQQRQQEQQQAPDSSETEQDGAGSSIDNHMLSLRLLFRLVLHLIYQLLNFICNRNRSYEERPISRLPNPFRVEETGGASGGERGDLPHPMPLDLEPGLHNLTTLLETVRMASEELRNDSVGDGVRESSPSQESTVPITNVPRRLTDFLRRSGNLAQQQDLNSESGRTGSVGSRSSSPWPQLVIPRITLSDPNGSESQVEEENSPSGPASGPSHNDQAEFSTRSVSGIPLRLLGRQYAVDRRSPDSEDSPGPPDGAQDGPGHPPDPPFPRRGHLTPYDIGLPRGPGSEMLFRPNLQRAPPDRAAEREADNFFSRPYFTAHFGASRILSGSVVTCRIQAWDFTHYRIPDISDGITNVVVGKCKIHNDASVDISADGTMLAALVPESQAMTMVGVYSLEDRSLGQLLYSYIFAPNTICVSLSPMARHLVVGFASNMPRLVPHLNTKQVVAQIYKLYNNSMFHRRGQAGHLQYVRDIEVMNGRDTSLNCIRWLPYPGQGLIYGNNKGQLNILR